MTPIWFGYDLFSSIFGQQSETVNKLGAKPRDSQLEEQKHSASIQDLERSNQLGAVDKFLNTIELVEAVHLELPIVDVVRAQRVCKRFKAIIECSPRLQHHLFLRLPARTVSVKNTPDSYMLNPIFDPGNESFRADRLAIAGWKFDLAITRRPTIVENISPSSKRTRDIVQGSKGATDAEYVARLAHGTEFPQLAEERLGVDASNWRNESGNHPDSSVIGDRSCPYAIKVSLQRLDSKPSSPVNYNELWRKMSITQPPLPIICDEFDLISRPPPLGLAEKWYSIGELCADDCGVR